MTDQVIRFGVGTPDRPYVPAWRLWANRSDVYLATRDTARSLKISLHESGQWLTQFTEHTGISPRRHMTWHRPAPFAEGVVQGPTVTIPYVPWAGELGVAQKTRDPGRVTWLRPPNPGVKVAFMTLFTANRDIDIRPVSLQTDFYFTGPLQLKNSEAVWLTVRYEPLAPGEPEYLDRLEREFRVFKTMGRPADTNGFGLDVHNDRLLVIQFPLGLRHFTFVPSG